MEGSATSTSASTGGGSASRTAAPLDVETGGRAIDAADQVSADNAEIADDLAGGVA